MSSSQTCAPAQPLPDLRIQTAFEWGTERRYERAWQPHQPTLEKLKSYLLGFPAHGKTIFPKRQYIADQIGIKVRTLARYLKWLSDAGWLVTVARKAHFAIRKVLQSVTKTAGPSPGPCIEVTSEEPRSNTEVLSLRDHSDIKPPAVIQNPARPDRFQEYFGVFVAAGKPLRWYREHQVFQLWISVEPSEPEQQALIAQAVKSCREASEPRFCPDPGVWLRRRPDGKLDLPYAIDKPILKPIGKFETAMNGAREILRKRGLL